ncbi:hypothetical protein [Pedobacter heparinus]|uniref:hypothetical protein n=1 Tax=Pedobacter heparinus TaxID=984 RepID=UPI00292E13D2|nr:hypothetical protein [Pedobacter heparinus]
MGRFDGKRIIGLVGGLVFKKGRNGKTIIQSGGREVKQTKASKIASAIFAKASTLSKAIRTDLSVLINGFYDGPMVNRLNKQNREILEQCYNKATKQYAFNEDSFSRLAGFEFNASSPLSKSLWVEPELTLTGNQLTLSLPAMEINEQLKFPSPCNRCEITVAVAFYNLEKGVHKDIVFQVLEVNTAQGLVPAKDFTFEVPDGCLCVIGIKLGYSTLKDNVKIIKNNKEFNPAGLCGAVITPGEFVLTPGVVVPHGKLASVWKTVDKLRLLS